MFTKNSSVKKKALININIIWYKNLYHKYFDTNFYSIQKEFMSYIEMSKKQLMKLSLDMTNKEIKLSHIDDLYNDLTKIYVELYNGMYNPLNVELEVLTCV